MRNYGKIRQQKLYKTLVICVNGRRGMQDRNLLLLVMMLVLISFFASNFIGITGTVTREAFVRVTDYSCVPLDVGFLVCGKIGWGGVDGYSKGYVLGGEKLSQSQRVYENSFRYCQEISGEEGRKSSVQAYVYDNRNSLVALDKTNVVECRKEREVGEKYTKDISFRAQANTGHGAGFGQVEIKMPGEPVSCSLDGEYLTDDKEFSGIQQYCHKAEGKLNGFFDFYEQYVEEDPEFFRWAGGSKPASNPLPKRYDGEVLHVRLCDHRYYQEDGERYYVKARVTSRDPLRIDWEYFNDDTRPAVDFTFSLDCRLKEEARLIEVEDRGQVEGIGEGGIASGESGEGVEDVETIKAESLESEEIKPFSFPVREISLWEKIKGFFRNTFL